MSPAGPVVLLETDRLVLRQLTPADVDNLVRLDADPEVMHFITGGLPTSRAEIEGEVLPRWLRYYEESEVLGFWAAEDRVTGEFLGWFHLRPGEGHPSDEPELGYRLVRHAWGRGLATEGSRALIDVAFARTDARRVLAETMAVHAASRRVMEKAGLRLVRAFRADWPYPIPGDEEGDVEYAVERDEWPGPGGPGVVEPRPGV
jgi:RimJ/RimL family protein N-acetyltransferase